jgi:hypothetical protein
MTKGPWKYQKAQGHHHVLMGEESLDVNSESDARIIALVPKFVKLVKFVDRNDLLEAYDLARQLTNKLRIIADQR